MKKTFLFLFLMTVPMVSPAMMMSLETHENIASVDFSNRFTLRYENNRTADVRKCQKVPNSFGNESAGFKVVGDIQHCHVNIIPYKINQYYFFEQNGQIYFKHVKTLRSYTYEVKSIQTNEIQLGRLVEVN